MNFFKYFKCIYFQLVLVMELVQVVCSVLIQLVNAPAILVTKARIVMLLVVVILLVQAVQHVMLLLDSALAKLVIQVSYVILVLLITIEQVMDLVQVSFLLYDNSFQNHLKCYFFQPVAAMPLVQAVCNVLIQLVFVHAMLVIKGHNAMLLVVVILLGQAVRHVISQLGNVLVKLVIQVSHVVPVQLTIIEQMMEHAQVRFIISK